MELEHDPPVSPQDKSTTPHLCPQESVPRVNPLDHQRQFEVKLPCFFLQLAAYCAELKRVFDVERLGVVQNLERWVWQSAECRRQTCQTWWTNSWHGCEKRRSSRTSLELTIFWPKSLARWWWWCAHVTDVMAKWKETNTYNQTPCLKMFEQF